MSRIERSDAQPATAVITGATRGLGRALALAFAREGYRVYGVARGEAGLRELAEDAEREGLDVLATRADVSSDRDTERLAKQMKADGVRLDVLVHNAGLLGERKSLAEYPVNVWDAVMAVNLRAPFLLTQRLLPVLGRGAAVIFVTSGASIGARPGWGAYNISKLALDGLAALWARELADDGVRVYLVDPGAMRTEMRAAAYPDEDPETLDPPERRTAGFLWLARHGDMKMSGGRFRAEELGEE